MESAIRNRQSSIAGGALAGSFDAGTWCDLEYVALRAGQCECIIQCGCFVRRQDSEWSKRR
ncbi:MAG: hypothetical protein V3W34_17225 [Phycisphaerae bacterium]